jgi:hypothetical protein
MSDCTASLSGCGEPADVFTASWRIARKGHRCYECSAPIVRGDRCEHVSMLYEGEWHALKICAACAAVATALSPDGSRVIGLLWEDVRENVFPAGTFAGCLARIEGVAGREKLSAEWRKWKGIEVTP